MKHRFSKEILYHFNCGKCNKWWSISDYHLLSNNKPDMIVCPHCEHKEKLIEIKENEKGRLD
jgi:DNA-directed RNA polymerase subunit RPC12/RpoP